MESGQEARFSDGRRERENNRQHELDAEIDRQKDNEGITAPHDKMIDKNIHERNWKPLSQEGPRGTGRARKERMHRGIFFPGRVVEVVEGNK